jgi:hypothetical protein
MNLLRLLKLEWLKFSPNGTFRVFVGLYMGSFALVVFLARSVGHNMTFESNGAVSHPLTGMFDYPNNWELLACIGSWMNLFVLGLLGVFMITLEFGNRTLRQNIIFGLTRMEVAVAKLGWVAALALGATIFYLLVGFGGELADGGGLPPVDCVVRFYLQALGYLLLGSLVGLLIRQTALAVLAYLAYVVFLETVCRWLFYFTVAKTRLLLFLPDQVLGSLTPLPVPASVNHMVYSTASTQPLSATEAVIGAAVYLVLFGVFICRRMVKADL